MKIEVSDILGILRAARQEFDGNDPALDAIDHIRGRVDDLVTLRTSRAVTRNVVRAQNSRIKNFVEDRLEFQDDTFTSNADIYEAWKLWLERHPDTSTVADAFMLRNAFSRFLGDVIGESARRGRVQRTPSTEDSHSSVIATYGWYGLRLKSEPTPTPGGVMVEDVRP